MAGELAPVVGLLTDLQRLSEWRLAVLSVDGRKVSAAPVELRRGPAVKVVETSGSRERTTTVPASEWPARVELLLQAAERIEVLGPDGDWHARRSKRGRWLVSRGRPSQPSNRLLQGQLAPHDRARRHLLSPDDPDALRLLVATGLFSPEGRLRKPQAAKYRQVQHYLELLRPLPVWGSAGPIRVVDAGCGKAYMSLALCAWARVRGFAVELVGVDANPEVLETIAGVAAELGYDARFEATTIWDYAQAHEDGADLLVSLHACDTATDEALAGGIVLGAEAIALAPCCHRELARQLVRRDDWSASILRHGLLRGRFADVLTDSLRASALEAFGYRAEAIEFVAAEHTAKNVMIRGVRRPPGKAADRAKAHGLAAYEALAARWGVEPTLRRLLADRWPHARNAA